MAVILILASSSGISFVIHHCSDNHTSEFHLFTSDYQCDHEKTENCGCCCGSEENSADESNCSISNNHKCCSNTKGFFKVTDNYDFSRYQFKINPQSAVNISITKPVNSLVFNTFLYTNTSSPPHLCGQEVLTHISQFLI